MKILEYFKNNNLISVLGEDNIYIASNDDIEVKFQIIFDDILFSSSNTSLTTEIAPESGIEYLLIYREYNVDDQLLVYRCDEKLSSLNSNNIVRWFHGNSQGISWQDTTFICNWHTVEATDRSAKISLAKIISVKYLNEGLDIFADKEGYGNLCNGLFAHCEGYQNMATGMYSHAEGQKTQAPGAGAHAEGGNNVASGTFSHCEGNNNQATQTCAHAEGNQTKALGQGSHAEGVGCQTNGMAAHVEGYQTIGTGQACHVEGQRTKATKIAAHAEGYQTEANGQASHAEGYMNITNGDFSFISGNNNQSEGQSSLISGGNNYCSGDYSFIQGTGNSCLGVRNGCIIGVNNFINQKDFYILGSIAKDTNIINILSTDGDLAQIDTSSISVGDFVYIHYTKEIREITAIDFTNNTITVKEPFLKELIGSGYNQIGIVKKHSDGSYHSRFIFGQNNIHSGGNNSFIIGINNINIKGQNNCLTGYSNKLFSKANNIIGGWYNQINFNNSLTIGYEVLNTANDNSVVGGIYNTDPSINNKSGFLILGKGASRSSRANAFRVGKTGAVFGYGSYNSSGADYAEYFEWLDGNKDNEDRRGLFVTLNEDKIALANEESDFILGIVSGNPTVIGDSYEDQWHGMFMKDIFGTPIMETVTIPAELDEQDNEVIPAHEETREKLNPDYQQQNYVGRSQRAEWAPIGMMGKLVVCDNGTCVPNFYAKSTIGGLATMSIEKTKYRVLKRIDDTHVLVLIL